MFNFDSDQQEVDFSYHHIVQVIFVLVLLESDVKTVFNPNLSRKLRETRNKNHSIYLHFDRIIDFGSINKILDSKSNSFVILLYEVRVMFVRIGNTIYDVAY